jgi:hypothetical protein
MLRRVSKLYYDDFCQRFEAAPVPQDESARFVWLDDTDKEWPNFLNDVLYYADEYGPDSAPEMTRAAKRLAKQFQ